MSEARTFAAIPTTYAGVRFRSRLEARWACAFDQLQWKWSYEPADYPGWIPDFMLYSAGADVLCEVKPYDRIHDQHAQEGVMDIWRSAPRDAHVLLLGKEGAAYVREPGHPVPDVAPGAVEPWRVGWRSAIIGWTAPGKLDVWPLGAPRSLLHDELPGGAVNPNGLADIWRKTLNPTQYRAPK